MKRKIALIALILAIFIIAVFFVMNNSGNAVASEDDLITGWAWSSSAGWVSLNCFNDYSNLKENRCTNDYGLNISVDEVTEISSLSGYAWSTNLGWLCFGLTCQEPATGLGNAPSGLAPEVIVNESGLLSGWANVVSEGSNGWLSVLGNSLAGEPFSDKVDCLNCEGGGCGICFDSEDYNGSGSIYENCTECSGTLCSSCESGYEYGTTWFKAKDKLLGWAWNSYGNESGLGWLHFIDEIGDYPYLETLYGDVYAQEGIENLTAPPEGRYNATFMVQSGGGIEKFYSEYELTKSLDWKQEYFDQLEFPKSENKYRSNLGDIDFSGIYAGQYGEIVNITGNSIQINNLLGGKIYYSAQDLTLNSKQFNNGTLSTQNGAGTIIVKGDLYINGDLTYDSNLSSYAKLKNIASLGVFVLENTDGTGGNVYINSTVKEIVGSYYAEGKVYTGTNSPAVDIQLEVNGMLMASGFEFQRQFIDVATKESAEKIIYDRKALVNPPPGFVNLIKVLPDWYK